MLETPYDAANEPDSAIVHFERFIAAKFPGRLGVDNLFLAVRAT